MLKVKLLRCEVNATRTCLMQKVRKAYQPLLAVEDVTTDLPPDHRSWEPSHRLFSDTY